MTADDDRELLRQFVQTRDQYAFAELVRRHIDLVYSSAQRQLSDPAAAEDATQSVFVLLAAKAHTIGRDGALAGWLLAATRGVALNMLRGGVRRRRHEREAAIMKSEILPTMPTEAERGDINRVLDAAIAQLKPGERDALVLRYFQDHSTTEVAEALGISAAAARKRVSRAVAQLRTLFARRGVRTSAETLCAALAADAVKAAPVSLQAATVAQSALSTAQDLAATQGVKGMAILMATIDEDKGGSCRGGRDLDRRCRDASRRLYGAAAAGRR